VTSNAAVNCTACGSFQTVQDPTGQWWNSYWENDFRTTDFITLNNTFVLMHQPVNRTGSVNRNFTPDNVAIDSNGLHLTVAPASSDGSVPSGGVFTKSKDFGFGYYNFEAQLSSQLGTVRAFYVYFNDSNEVDIESPNNNNLVDYSVKPQLYTAAGGPASSTLKQVHPQTDLSLGPHNYTFIWNPTRVDFSVDGQFNDSITTNVPQLPGTLSLSHWSDGNPGYSGGPPTQNATLTITKVFAYYNASTPVPCPASCTTSSSTGTSTGKPASSRNPAKTASSAGTLSISSFVSTLAGIGALVVLL